MASFRWDRIWKHFDDKLFNLMLNWCVADEPQWIWQNWTRISKSADCKSDVAGLHVISVPRVIQSHQRINFTSGVCADMSWKLHIKHIQSTACHPESPGEIKSLLHSYCADLEVGRTLNPWRWLLGRSLQRSLVLPQRTTCLDTVLSHLAVLQSNRKRPPPPPPLHAKLKDWLWDIQRHILYLKGSRSLTCCIIIVLYDPLFC